MTRILSLLVVCGFLGACSSAQPDDDLYAMTLAEQALVSQGMVVKTIPDEDPGPPFYARVTPLLNQLFVDGETLVIPFYRGTDCVPPDFDLMQIFHFPDPPNHFGAFECPLSVWGRLLIEADAPMGTFPKLVTLFGEDVTFFFVPWTPFQAAMQNGPVTMGVLEDLGAVAGSATRFNETLRPREGEHHIVINAGGQLDDGRRFTFHVTHIEDQTKSIRLQIR